MNQALTSDIKSILQANIRSKLDQKRMSICELERRAGLKQSTVQNILLGRSKNPGVETIYVLAKELGCSIEELLSSKDEIEQRSQRLAANLPWKGKIFIKAAQFVDHFIRSHSENVSLEKALMCINEIYAYSLREKTDDNIDEKFAEWITERNLMRN